jgi:hypothetical protein
MIGQYLSNNNENATVAFCQKFWHPNGALVGLVFFFGRNTQVRCYALFYGSLCGITSRTLHILFHFVNGFKTKQLKLNLIEMKQ